jgi:hypothetical protein
MGTAKFWISAVELSFSGINTIYAVLGSSPERREGRKGEEKRLVDWLGRLFQLGKRRSFCGRRLREAPFRSQY